MDERLIELVRRLGEEFGIEDVEVIYSPFRDFKIKTKRSSGWMRLEVSDYLCDAPDEVLEGMFRTIFKRLRGDWMICYPDSVREWLESADFRAKNQETYIKRSRHIDADSDAGTLWESYDRLVADGRMKRIDGLRLFWSDSGCTDKPGESSCLMRVASLNPALRDADAEVLDECLLFYLAGIQGGFVTDNEKRQELFTILLDTINDKSLDRFKEWLEQQCEAEE